MERKWLDWAQRIQAISQAGLAFSKDDYDLERFEELRKISVEIMGEYTNMDEDKVTELFANETGYQTPKLDVRGAVFKDGKILLVKEKFDQRWSLPGGFCDVGLSPSENIVKEIREESGYEVKAVKMLAVLDKNKHPHPPSAYHYYKLFIQCEIIGGQASEGLETSETGFFSENSLPELSTARNTESQVKMLFNLHNNPQKGTLFD